MKKLVKLKTSDFVKVKSNKVFKSNFFIFKAKITFTQSRKTFIKILIFRYFNLEYYIWIEINILNHIISKIFS